jgi:hypothetical protein
MFIEGFTMGYYNGVNTIPGAFQDHLHIDIVFIDLSHMRLSVN